MNVDPESAAAQQDYQGKTWYFCSGSCHSKFQADPAHYALPQTLHDHSQSENPAADSTLYTCPMHPEVEQPGPGACPKCGMALEPKGVPLVATKTEYTCPMHPEIIQDHPGACPKCGMALES
ncbi:MAG TPA: YHS domain-containing protein, partial [Gammaproteobacteria bacterium]|nr:YHS domain-containing protein [Gammaproteobacteria bacterium]